MSKPPFAFGLAVACLVVAAPAQAQGYSRTAQRVLAQARAAAGGAGWNTLRGWHEVGVQGGVRYEAWLDPVRYGLRIETREPAGPAVRGFNGGGEWRISAAGAVTGVDVSKTINQARTEAFYRVHGYFYPGRFDARGDYVGVRKFQGQAFDVVTVKPWGAAPRELWFDRRTHLLGRMVDRSGDRPLAWDFSDYRHVGAIRVAFRISAEPGAGPTPDERVIETLEFAPVNRDLFSLPRPAAAATAAPHTDAR
ncbi:MAG: hypothetical protein JWP86_2137 [Phenylobacterium sp.]|nr:hypothetical protein [Phenylobacterium sp.]